MKEKMIQIKLGGKTYTAKRPKARLWRDFMKYDEVDAKNPDMNLLQRFDTEIDFVVKAYDHPEVTAEVIMDNYGVDEIKSLYADVAIWLIKLWAGKLAQIPNEESPTV